MDSFPENILLFFSLGLDEVLSQHCCRKGLTGQLWNVSTFLWLDKHIELALASFLIHCLLWGRV